MTEIEQNRPHTAPTQASKSTLGRLSATLFGITMTSVAVVGGGYYAVHETVAVRERESGLDSTEEQGLPPAAKFGNDYRKWERPLVSLVVSGQMHGYTMPCGCSFPQYGGLVRRYNFIESLLTPDGKKGWDVVGIDLGEMAACGNLDPNDLDSSSVRLQSIPEQNLLKFDLSMKALSVMNYRAVGIGKSELLAPLGPALALTYDEKRPFPHPIALTLAGTAPGQNFHELNVRPYEIVDTVKPKIGIISMIGPDFRDADDIKKIDEKFLNNEDELPKALKAFADAGVEIGVILHHEYPNVSKSIQGYDRLKALDKGRRDVARDIAEYCAEARKKNPKIPEIHLIVVLTKEPEPPAVTQTLSPKLPTQLVEIGHKGKYVGLVGVYREGASYRLQYQIVLMSPDWDTKKGKEDKHPVMALMQKYADTVKQQNLISKSLRSPHYIQNHDPNKPGLQASFVGSERCGDCHAEAYSVWSGNNDKDRKRWHNVATATLVNEKYPSGRQFDPECIVCHSVGFKYPGGYNDPVNIALWPNKNPNPIDPKVLAKHNAKLSGVGCESCHGPGSLHVNNPNNLAVRKLMNPYGPSKEERALEVALKKDPTDTIKKNAFNQLFHRRMANLEQFCVKCHDHENDVHWGQKDDAQGIDLTIFAKWAKISHRTPGPQNNNGNPPPQGKKKPAELKLEVDKIGNVPVPEFRIEVEVEKK